MEDNLNFTAISAQEATTCLEDLLQNLSLIEENNKICDINTDNMCALLLDFSNPEDIRMKALSLFFESKGYEVIEILKKLVSVFAFAPTKTLEHFFTRVLQEINLPFSLCLETCKDICLYKDDSLELFNVLHLLMSKMTTYNVPFVQQIEAITTMMRHKAFREKSKEHMIFFLSNHTILSEFRYKVILGLKTTFDMRKPWLSVQEREDLDAELKMYQIYFLTFFAQDNLNDVTFRILAYQLLLVKFSEKDDGITESLLDIGKNEHIPYNSRADAIDVVLRHGHVSGKDKAKQVMLDLASQGGNFFTVYDNAQNAHTLEIEQSALQTFQQLAQIPNLINTSVTFDDVAFELQSMLDENAKLTLNRIRLDNALYGNLDLTLKTALILVYTFIKQSKDMKELLMTRLCEELSESAGICSTGIMERMANTFTGIIDTFGIRISLEDQILGVVSAQLNKTIKNLEFKPCLHQDYCVCLQQLCPRSKKLASGNVELFTEEDVECGVCLVCQQKEKFLAILQKRFLNRSDFSCVHVCHEHMNCNTSLIDKLFEEMVVPLRYFEKRQTFTTFFRKNFPFIYDSVYDEFKDLVDHCSFDLYMRKAVIHYVGEE